MVVVVIGAGIVVQGKLRNLAVESREAMGKVGGWEGKEEGERRGEEGRQADLDCGRQKRQTKAEADREIDRKPCGFLCVYIRPNPVSFA
jgi:hypothetical protein